jgi:endonuclease/exonuclease/phosphatase family metal-dependent hydrolase
MKLRRAVVVCGKVSARDSAPMRFSFYIAIALCLAGCRQAQTAPGAASRSTTQTAATTSAPVLPRQITILTYNVLADPIAVRQRVPALMAILKDSDADIIALQEVAPWFVVELKREPWVKKYYLMEDNGRFVSCVGQTILSRFPIESFRAVDLPGRQKRQAAVARLRVGGRSLEVGCVHLESPLKDGLTRAKQLDLLWPLLRGADDGMLVGDFNFGDGEQPDSAHLDGAYVDFWKALRPSEKGFTWDIEASDMAAQGSFPGEKSRRMDRILVRSKVWKPAEIRIIGDRPLRERDKSLFPSDHFGLIGVMVRN